MGTVSEPELVKFRPDRGAQTDYALVVGRLGILAAWHARALHTVFLNQSLMKELFSEIKLPSIECWLRDHWQA